MGPFSLKFDGGSYESDNNSPLNGRRLSHKKIEKTKQTSSGLSTRIFQAAPTMSHAAPTMSHAAHFADNFPKPWRLKRLLPAPKRLLGAAGAALLKALVSCIERFSSVYVDQQLTLVMLREEAV